MESSLSLDSEMESSETQETFTEQSKFLNGIHARFLDLVQPIESGLMDDLRADGVMSSDEEQLIRKEPTRRDKARKMWKLLNTVSPERFQISCYPAIKAKYAHVLEGKRFCWPGKCAQDQQCLRHAITKTMILRKFADVFPPKNACTENDYRIITECSDLDESKWDHAFQLCAKNSSNSEFMETLRARLQKAGVDVPDNYFFLLSNGFPCTCTSSSRPSAFSTADTGTMKTDTTEEVSTQTFWKRKCDLDQRTGSSVSVPTKNMKRHCTQMDTTASRAWSSCGYPSTGEEVSEKWSTESVSSHDTNDTVILGHNEGPKDADFAKRQDKVALLKEMREINSAVKKASSIRPLFRELDGIKLELSILDVTAKSETSGQGNDLSEIRRLRKKADDIFATIQRDFEFASRMNEQMTKSELSFDLPFSHRKNRLERIQMLGNETKEAATFAKLSEDVLKDMPPVPALSPVVGYGEKDSTFRLPEVSCDELCNRLG